MLINFLRKPGKLRAPGKFRPGDATRLDPEALVAEFRNTQLLFGELLSLGDGLDLGNLRHANPVLPILEMTAAQSFEVLSIHQLRHVAQIERALDRETA
jgi:hypothetical protein